MRLLKYMAWYFVMTAVCPTVGMAAEAEAAQGIDGEAVLQQLHQTQEELRQLRVQVNELRRQTCSNWLNERRVEEIESLVEEVLADADTRASLLEGGAWQGIMARISS